MSNRTQTVKNGHGEHGPRDVIWGPEVKRVVKGGFSLLVTIAGMVGGAAWYLAERITRVEDTAAAAQLSADTAAANTNTQAARGETVYVTRAELELMFAKQTAILSGRLDVVNSRLGHLEEGERYNRQKLSNIDLTPNKEEGDDR